MRGWEGGNEEGRGGKRANGKGGPRKGWGRDEGDSEGKVARTTNYVDHKRNKYREVLG